MSKNFSQKTFDYWLKHNSRYFPHHPQVLRHFRDHSTYLFHGINPAIQLNIDNRGSVEIWVKYKGILWDIIADFDVYEQRTSKGTYFCYLCEKEDHQVLYPTRQDLWIEHSFKPLLEWALEYLIDSNRLYLMGGSGDQYSAACIQSLDENNKIYNKLKTIMDLHIILPVVMKYESP